MRRVPDTIAAPPGGSARHFRQQIAPSSAQTCRPAAASGSINSMIAPISLSRFRASPTSARHSTRHQREHKRPAPPICLQGQGSWPTWFRRTERRCPCPEYAPPKNGGVANTVRGSRPALTHDMIEGVATTGWTRPIPGFQSHLRLEFGRMALPLRPADQPAVHRQSLAAGPNCWAISLKTAGFAGGPQPPETNRNVRCISNASVNRQRTLRSPQSSPPGNHWHRNALLGLLYSMTSS